MSKYDAQLRFFDSGGIDTIVNTKDKVRHGKYISYYENGRKKREANYVDGVLHGKHELWYKDGLRFYESMYVCGKIHGECTTWDSDGTVSRKQYFDHGRLEFYLWLAKKEDPALKDSISVDGKTYKYRVFNSGVKILLPPGLSFFLETQAFLNWHEYSHEVGYVVGALRNHLIPTLCQSRSRK